MILEIFMIICVPAYSLIILSCITPKMENEFFDLGEMIIEDISVENESDYLP